MSELLERLSQAIMSRIHPETRKRLPGVCDQLGLPGAPDDDELTKRQYIDSRLRKLSRNPAQVRRVAARFTGLYRLADGSTESFEIEELLWKEADHPILNKRLRREVADALDRAGEPFCAHGDGFMKALGELWVLQSQWEALSEAFGGTGNSLRRNIEQHILRNPGDWPWWHFFEEVGALECSDRRFGRFIEALAGPVVRPDEPSQRSFVATVNGVLSPHRLELAETGEADGYPLFSIRAIGTGATGRPKNLIFASSVKPDLRFRDAVNNDVEIVTHADKVLVYDKPIPADGLRWRHLQAWWKECQRLDDDDESKRALFDRLFSCLPESSPPQRLLFWTFHEHFGEAVPELPALLPEVWLHYDPRIRRERGDDALFRQRMDFLLLISPTTRIVIEVDGIQHYSREDGQASAQEYARMVSADRDLRLSGYDVYRFGGRELRGDKGKQVVARFFDQLFKKHKALG